METHVKSCEESCVEMWRHVETCGVMYGDVETCVELTLSLLVPLLGAGASGNTLREGYYDQ